MSIAVRLFLNGIGHARPGHTSPGTPRPAHFAWHTSPGTFRPAHFARVTFRPGHVSPRSPFARVTIRSGHDSPKSRFAQTSSAIFEVSYCIRLLRIRLQSNHGNHTYRNAHTHSGFYCFRKYTGTRFKSHHEIQLSNMGLAMPDRFREL